MKAVTTGAPPSTTLWALVGLSLTMLMPSLATSSANVAVPSLARAIGVSYQSAQWIVLSYLLTVTALVVGAGRLGDMLGRRRLLLAGIIVFAGGSLLSGVASTLELLIAARAVQGSGAAVMMALTMAFVGEVVPKERTGSAMGLLGTMSAVGTTLGPALGGILIAGAGPSAVFLINVPLAAVAFVIASRTLPKDSPLEASASSRFDLTGMGLLMIALVAYALATTVSRGHVGLPSIAAITASFAAAVAFVAVEARASAPLVRVELFLNQPMVAGLAASSIVSTVMMATLVVGPFYLTTTLGLGPAFAGFVLAAGPLVAAIAGIPSGRLVDRFGSDRTALCGLSVLGAGASILAVISPDFGVVGYVAPIVGMTAGYGLFQAANNTAIMSGTGPAERGVVSGLLNLSRNLGLVTGASAMGAVFAWGTATTDVVTAEPRAIASGMHATFAVATILITIALLIVLPRSVRAKLHRADDC